jgi:hypothetical protein
MYATPLEIQNTLVCRGLEGVKPQGARRVLDQWISARVAQPD